MLFQLLWTFKFSVADTSNVQTELPTTTSCASPHQNHSTRTAALTRHLNSLFFCFLTPYEIHLPWCWAWPEPFPSHPQLSCYYLRLLQNPHRFLSFFTSSAFVLHAAFLLGACAWRTEFLQWLLKEKLLILGCSWRGFGQSHLQRAPERGASPACGTGQGLQGSCQGQHTCNRENHHYISLGISWKKWNFIKKVVRIPQICSTRGLEQSALKGRLSYTGNDSYNISRKSSLQKGSKMLQKGLKCFKVF